MRSVTFLKHLALVALLGSIAACSSNPKVAEPLPEPEPVLAAAEPAKIVTTPRGPSLTLDDVLFDFEQATLRPEANGTINKAAAYLVANPQRMALVEGHTDHIGEPDYNQWLSIERSNTIKDALIARGVSSTRIKTKGLGETRPVADNQTSEGRQANRRVEIIFKMIGTQL